VDPVALVVGPLKHGAASRVGTRHDLGPVGVEEGDDADALVHTEEGGGEALLDAHHVRNSPHDHDPVFEPGVFVHVPELCAKSS
jgi:hypothetical protein